MCGCTLNLRMHDHLVNLDIWSTNSYVVSRWCVPLRLSAQRPLLGLGAALLAARPHYPCTPQKGTLMAVCWTFSTYPLARDDRFNSCPSLWRSWVIQSSKLSVLSTSSTTKSKVVLQVLLGAARAFRGSTGQKMAETWMKSRTWIDWRYSLEFFGI